MNPIRLISHKYVQSKFRRRDWRIIETLSAEQFEQTLLRYRESGWEATDIYRSFNAELERWRCKLKRGTSTLRCEWEKDRQGRIYGPSRVVNGLAKEYGFDVQSEPSPR